MKKVMKRRLGFLLGIGLLGGMMYQPPQSPILDGPHQPLIESPVGFTEAFTDYLNVDVGSHFQPDTHVGDSISHQGFDHSMNHLQSTQIDATTSMMSPMLP